MYANTNIKKVLYINSYHVGYPWSDEIEKSIKDTLLKSNLSIDLKIFHMDTRRKNEVNEIKEVALKAKKLIDLFQPDIVISSDDNAAKYLIVPYFSTSTIPFIFCGINGNAKKYSFPLKNVTGMLEVNFASEMLKELQHYTKGKRIGYLNDNTKSAKDEATSYSFLLNEKIEQRFVNSVEDWKKEYLFFQENVDILFLGYSYSIKNWEKSQNELIDFVRNNTKIVSSSGNSYMKELSLLVLSISPQEHGTWAAQKAIEVLKGKDITTIEILKNQKADIYINSKLLKKLEIVFSFNFIDNAILVQ